MEAWLYDNQAVLSRDTVKAAAREIAGMALIVAGVALLLFGTSWAV